MADVVNGRRVLIVDDDRDLVEIVSAALGDEGYEVLAADDLSEDAVRAAVGRHEPDCVLLDSAGTSEYGSAWATAALIRDRRRPVPTVMFTAHVRDADEADAGISERARAAAFVATLRKPFALDDLLAAVETAVAAGSPFDGSRAAERARTRDLVAALEQAGATEIRPSMRREWANFRNANGEEVQLYWWQSGGRYLVGSYTRDGVRLHPVGHFFEMHDAVAASMQPQQEVQVG